MPAESITGSRGAATVAELRAMDEKAVDAELKKTSHDDRIKVATAIYATLVAPGTQSAIMMQTFQKVDSEALRIGLLNANYDRSYREGNWHDIIMYLNGYDDLGIAEHVAKWQTSELTEGIFQARQQFGPSGEAMLGGPMLKRLPPPAAAPGKLDLLRRVKAPDGAVVRNRRLRQPDQDDLPAATQRRTANGAE